MADRKLIELASERGCRLKGLLPCQNVTRSFMSKMEKIFPKEIDWLQEPVLGRYISQSHLD